MEEVDMPELVESLGSPDDSIRKRAAFRLQSIIGDPSFADTFEAAGGISELRALALTANGNTLAYSLASFSRLLELEQGWSAVDQKLIGRLVQLVVTHPLVNILRGAMSILALVVARPSPKSQQPEEDLYGFRALKPAIDTFPNFLEMLVSRLSSADSALCANALQLVNSLMRDSISNDPDDEWPKFIKRLQDLGVIKAVYTLMQGRALQELAHPLLEFQCLTKMLLRKWRDTPVDQEKRDHRRALKAVYAASKPSGYSGSVRKRDSRERDPEKWRQLGFDTESPMDEFGHVGYLGIMDLTDFARKSEDGFHKLILEQSNKPASHRCPVAKASLAVTSIIYEHFEIDNADVDDEQRYMALESRSSFDKVFRPLLLQWSRLHTAGLQAFLRLWQSTSAEVEEFCKIEELVKILIEQVIGLALRTDDVQKVEQDLANYELQQLWELQMELLELTHEDAWGHHLRQIKEELHHEALQFLKEQRIRCLLAGSWFPNLPTSPYQPPPTSAQPKSPTQPTSAILNSPYAPTSPLVPVRPSVDSHLSQATQAGIINAANTAAARTSGLGISTYTGPSTAPPTGPLPPLPPHRFVRLSHNRRYLHYADFDVRTDEPPPLTALEQKVALSAVSSVVSNVEGPEDAVTAEKAKSPVIDDHVNANSPGKAGQVRASLTSTRSAPTATAKANPQMTQTTITILGLPPAASSAAANQATTTGAQDTTRPQHPTPRSPAQAKPSTPLSPQFSQFQQLQNQQRRNISGASPTPSHANPSMLSIPLHSRPNSQQPPETVLLTLHIGSTSLAAEWLDGLLMLLNQAPVTAETRRLVRFVAGVSRRCRFLDVRFDGDVGGGRAGSGGLGGKTMEGGGAGGDGKGKGKGKGVERGERRVIGGEIVLPSREGVDDEFFYEIGNE